MTPKRFPHVLPFLPGVQELPPIVRCTTPGVGQIDPQSGLRKKSLTQENLQTLNPKESWTHVYTDGSAKNAVRNGGAGAYIQYPGGTEDKISLAASLCSTNNKAEVDALKAGAATMK